MDWIVGLPESHQRSTGEKMNSILTIVCQSIKIARFIPTQTNISMGNFARLFFEHIECIFGMPLLIVSDQDSRITSKFWAEICSLEIIKWWLSTAFYLQTDGQSKALNRIVESYLCAYCVDKPTAWVNLLPLAQFAYNNSMNATTNTMPNNLLFGMDYNIWFHVNGTPREKIPEAHVRIKKLHELHQRL